MRILRLAALIGASTVAAGGTAVLLLPVDDAPQPSAHHAHGAPSTATTTTVPSPAATDGSAAIPRLQFDPVELTAVLADAVAHDPSASQEPSSGAAAQVAEPQLLYRGVDEDERITAGLAACVAEGGAAALQLQYDLREDAGTWVVERRSVVGTPC